MAKREMTEEQKKAATERMRAARAKKAAEKAAAEAEAEKAPFEEIEDELETAPVVEKEPAEDPMLKALREQNELLQKQILAMQEQMAALAMPKVIQVAAGAVRRGRYVRQDHREDRELPRAEGRTEPHSRFHDAAVPGEALADRAGRADRGREGVAGS